jgi:hypothetical protein
VRNGEDGLKIKQFHGDIVCMDRAEALALKNEYLILLRKGTYLNCQQAAESGRCVTSMVNTPRGLKHRVTGNYTSSNTSLQVNGDQAWLVTNGTAIPANGEYFFAYGNGFRIPFDINTEIKE